MEFRSAVAIHVADRLGEMGLSAEALATKADIGLDTASAILGADLEPADDPRNAAVLRQIASAFGLDRATFDALLEEALHGVDPVADLDAWLDKAEQALPARIAEDSSALLDEVRDLRVALPRP
jgi:protein-disulfide isomerase-like protein with CxxC motif